MLSAFLRSEEPYGGLPQPVCVAGGIVITALIMILLSYVGGAY